MLRHRFTRLFGEPSGKKLKKKKNSFILRAISSLNQKSPLNPQSSTQKEEWMGNIRGEKWLEGPRDINQWYTGKVPIFGECPGVSSVGLLTSLPQSNLDSVDRQSTLEYFDNSWTMYEMLFAGLNGEEVFFRPPDHGLRHPNVFYYGHTACLYVNKLRCAGILTEPVDTYLESIFEVGVDEMKWDDMQKNDMLWPTIEETREYRKKVYEIVQNVIEAHLSSNPTKIDWNHPLWALFMGFEHERIHFETSSVLIRETPLDFVQQPLGWPSLHPSAKKVQSQEHGNARNLQHENPMLHVNGDIVKLGKPRNFPSYGWDNEYGTRKVNTSDFKASKFMITNGEYLHFMINGGYNSREYWSNDGWQWKSFRNIKLPNYWKYDGPQGLHAYNLRTIFEEISMPMDWPVEVNHHEAQAYCKWKSIQDATKYRLPSESEWNLLKPSSKSLKSVRKHPLNDPVMSHSGAEFQQVNGGGMNLNLAFSSPSPVGGSNSYSRSGAMSESGHCDTMGNVWEHVEDQFNPLEEGFVSYLDGEHFCNFKIHPVYDDFSIPCYDGKHHLIMGGSFASTGNLASSFARYHFRPHFHQHSGFRLVEQYRKDAIPPVMALQGEDGFKLMSSAATSETVKSDNLGLNVSSCNDNKYDTRKLVDQYLGLHYSFNSGSMEKVPFMLPHAAMPSHTMRFPQRVAELLFQVSNKTITNDGSNNYGVSRALDLGCAVGGTSFTLATKYDEVIGIDFSHSFINAANEMKNSDGSVYFKVPMEGELVVKVKALHEDGISEREKQKVFFQQGDACNLKESELGRFDAIVMANLLCRLPNPLECLDSISRMTNINGTVVITTPYSWLETFTAKERWLGGYIDPVNNEAVESADILLKAMESRGFERIYQEPIALTIREHSRKYEYIIAEATAWTKKR